MIESFDFKQMIAGFLEVQNESGLHAHLERCAIELGFEQFAMGHHVDLTGPPENAIRVTNYHPGWIEQSLGERHFVQDPVHLASTRTAMGFLWSDVPAMVKMTERQAQILKAARPYGLCEGYTVPVHVPGEYRGTCSFGATSLENLARNGLPFANLIGTYAFEAARRIMRTRVPVPRIADELPILSERQRDALVLIGRGKADPEIGTLLGISASTAHEHVENVRKAYGNAQRPLLIARALFDGQISFMEIFGR
ncbi:MAG: autoinducer binding domain-containing protein [Sphingobium sp.]|nr:autoinducer binding domain-containing protein [Sphingobium sp.]